MKNLDYIALILMLVGLVISIFSILAGFQFILLLVGVVLFAAGGYLWYEVNKSMPESMSDVQDIWGTIDFARGFGLGALGAGTFLLLIAFTLMSGREVALGFFMLLVSLLALGGGAYLVFAYPTAQSDSQELYEVEEPAPIARVPEVQATAVSTPYSRVADLPAVKDSMPLINAIISIERGSGFNLGGTIRTIVWVLIVVLGLLFALGFGVTVELLSGNDWVALFVFLVAALVLGGLLYRAGRQLFPNVEEARRALKTGEIPLDDILEGLNAREPGNAEMELLTSALGAFQEWPEIEFDEWYVLPSSLPVTYGFGRVLVISREALESPDLPYILAHELGHLNNGDGFVRSAVWSLGKGFFGTENITLFGSVSDDDRGDYSIEELSSLGRSLSQKDWVGALTQAVSTSLTSRGVGVKRLRRPIRNYFKAWDIEADKFALKYVDQNGYLQYISGLEQFERGTGEGPFNAPAIHRFDAIEAVVVDKPTTT